MSYTVTIHFGGGDRTYPVQRDGFSLEHSVGAKGKHQTQTAAFTIRSREAALLFLTSKEDIINAELNDGSETVFEGVVRPYRNFSAKGNREDVLSLEILDYTEALHIYAPDDTVFQAKSIAEIFRTLYDRAGIVSELVIPSTLETKTIDYWKCSKGSYYDEGLSQMLYEFGYDFRFSVRRCEIIPTVAESAAESITDIRNTFAVSRSDDRNQGVRVRYPSYQSKRMRIADHESVEFKHSLDFLQFTAYKRMQGYYYNNRMDPESRATTKWLKWSPEEVSISDVIGISDVRYDWYINQPDYIMHGPRNWLNLVGSYNYDLTGAAVSIQYDAQFNTGIWQGGWRFVIKADALVRYRVDNAEEAYTAGDSPNVISAQFITTAEDAEALARREVARLTQASVEYSFDSLTWYEPGRFYNLSDSVTGVSTVVRVLSCEMGPDGIFAVKCEGAGDVGTSVDVKTVRLKDLSEAGAEYMRLDVDDSELDEGESCTVSVSGTILDMQSEYGFTYKWYVNGTELDDTGLSVTIPAGRLKGGINEIRCDSLYQGEVHASAVARVTNLAVSETQIEYAVGNSPDNPPLGEMLWKGQQMYWEGEAMSWDDGVWGSEAPTPSRGQYLWMRTRRT